MEVSGSRRSSLDWHLSNDEDGHQPQVDTKDETGGYEDEGVFLLDMPLEANPPDEQVVHSNKSASSEAEEAPGNVGSDNIDTTHPSVEDTDRNQFGRCQSISHTPPLSIPRIPVIPVVGQRRDPTPKLVDWLASRGMKLPDSEMSFKRKDGK